jgi:hypothetical protein
MGYVCSARVVGGGGDAVDVFVPASAILLSCVSSLVYERASRRALDLGGLQDVSPAL